MASILMSLFMSTMKMAIHSSEVAKASKSLLEDLGARIIAIKPEFKTEIELSISLVEQVAAFAVDHLPMAEAPSNMIGAPGTETEIPVTGTVTLHQ